MKDNPRYNAILEKVFSLKAALDALWREPGGGKNIPPSEANEIATTISQDIQNVIHENNINLARYAQSQAKL